MLSSKRCYPLWTLSLIRKSDASSTWVLRVQGTSATSLPIQLHHLTLLPSFSRQNTICKSSLTPSKSGIAKCLSALTANQAIFD